MSIFDRRPGLRWAVPAGAAVLFVGGAALTPLAATADSGLEPRTAQELLVALSAAQHHRGLGHGRDEALTWACPACRWA